MNHRVSTQLGHALIAYPQQAAFGRLLPKRKIYEHTQANTRLKDLFVAQVEKIIWQYKLAPETIKLPDTKEVLELQVFTLELKTPDVNREVLRCIDKAIPFPIIFELSFDGHIQVIAAYKRLNESDASRWVLSDYFATAWLPSAIARTTLPIALDLSGLYAQILYRLIPIPARPQERLADFVDRAELVSAKQRELMKVSGKLAQEKQFNRKVEINAHLRQLKSELQRLTQ